MLSVLGYCLGAPYGQAVVSGILKQRNRNRRGSLCAFIPAFRVRVFFNLLNFNETVCDPDRKKERIRERGKGFEREIEREKRERLE